jgi:hypothetical protein
MVQLNEPFFITILIDRRQYQLQVECISRDKVNERYKATFGKHVLILECNWPVFRNRGLKHRMPDWKMIEGKLTYRSSFKYIVNAIEKHIINLHA